MKKKMKITGIVIVLLIVCISVAYILLNSSSDRSVSEPVETESVPEYSKEIYSDTEPLEEATEKEVTTKKDVFSITKDTSECDNVFWVEDDRFSEPTDTMIEDDFGIAFTDTLNGTSETIAIVKVKYCEEIHGENAISAEIIGRNENALLIEVYVGVLYSYSFLYKTDTNELIKLEPDGEWYFTDNTMLIGGTVALSYDMEINLYAYNWNGELLYTKEKILPANIVSGEWLYFAEMNEGETEDNFKVYKMKLDGTEQTEHYSVTLSKGSYFTLTSGYAILWQEHGKEVKLDLYTLQPIN